MITYKPEDIEQQEADFVNRSDEAFHAAYKQAMAAGISVLMAEDGVIYEIFPDGRKIKQRTIAKPTSRPKGTKIRLG